MSKIEQNIQSNFYNKVASLLKEARRSVVQTVSAEFNLSLSHYFKLMRIDNEDERKLMDKKHM